MSRQSRSVIKELSPGDSHAEKNMRPGRMHHPQHRRPSLFSACSRNGERDKRRVHSFFAMRVTAKDRRGPHNPDENPQRSFFPEPLVKDAANGKIKQRREKIQVSTEAGWKTASRIQRAFGKTNSNQPEADTAITISARIKSVPRGKHSSWCFMDQSAGRQQVSDINMNGEICQKENPLR